MKANELQKKYLDFFIKKNHSVFADQGIIPLNDTSLLWVNAGIVHLKKFFLEEAIPPNKSLVSIQKCVRLNDIDLIGKSNHHHTLFEMLGFFAIGSYFKKTAISNALEFFQNLKLKKEQIYVTIHPDDKKSLEILLTLGISKQQIFCLHSNFWDLGSGPCGPCLEFFYDKGKKYGNVTTNTIKNEIDNDRYVEIMNIVFSSFNHVNDHYEKLVVKKIDMGSGFERLLAVLNDVESAYETDLFQDSLLILRSINNNASKASLRIIVDHLRTVYMMIHSNILPGPKNRNYIVKMLIKKIALQLYFSKTAKIINELEKIIYPLVIHFSQTTPDIINNFSFILKQMKQELNVFLKMINNQKEVVTKEIMKIKNSQIDAKFIFRLYETRGIDLEVINQVCSLHNKTYSQQMFQKHLLHHKTISRNKQITKGYHNDFLKTQVTATTFIGYNDQLENTQKILDIIKSREGRWIVVKETPFYPEGGGQVSDTGIISKAKQEFFVSRVIKKNNVIFHLIKNSNNVEYLKKNILINLKVDAERRHKIEANHSATHLLHYHLRNILGKGTLQAGTAKNAEKLRLDFTTMKKFDKQEVIKIIEERIRQDIKANLQVKSVQFTLAEAKKQNFLLTFLEEYSKHSKLRGVIIGNSKELCVGTHVNATNQIQNFVITNFKTKGLNTYRIEALTKVLAKEFLAKKETLLKQNVQKKKESGFNPADFDIIKLKNPQCWLLKLNQKIKQSDLLNYYDRKYKQEKVVIFLTGTTLNNVMICVNKDHHYIIEHLKSNLIIKGGGRKDCFMGQLQTNITQFIKILYYLL